MNTIDRQKLNIDPFAIKAMFETAAKTDISWTSIIFLFLKSVTLVACYYILQESIKNNMIFEKQQGQQQPSPTLPSNDPQD